MNPYPWTLLMIDPAEIPAFTAKMAGCKYRLGAKAKSLGDQLSEIDEIDCSGFVRLLVFKACGVVMPDGSWNQGQYLKEHGFKASRPIDCFRRDGYLRVLVMRAKDGRPGHIAFCLNGRTYESYGGHGPGSRLFTMLSTFQRTATVYVLARGK